MNPTTTQEGTMQDTQTIGSFIEEQGITATVAAADSNPHMTDEWARTANHWRVTLRNSNGNRWTIPFSQGSAHTKPPTAEDVLDIVASDVTGYRNAQDLADFMAEYGYDNVQEARKTYHAIGRQSDRLNTFLDAEAVEALLYNTERL